MHTLMYHNVIEQKSDLPIAKGQVTMDAFRRQMDRLRRHILHPQAVDEALQQGKTPRGILITFDDGAAGVIHAADILAEKGLTGVVFICPAALQNGLWFYRLADGLVRATASEVVWAGEPLPLINPEQRRTAYRILSTALFEESPAQRDKQLAMLIDRLRPEGITPLELQIMDEGQLRHAVGRGSLMVANHSWSHPNVTTLNEADLHREISAAQGWLERSGLPVLRWFAFPRGAFNTETVHAAKESCHALFSATAHRTDPALLPRTEINALDNNLARFTLKTGLGGHPFRQIISPLKARLKGIQGGV